MLKSGQIAPDFQLFDQEGALVRLSDMTEKGPVVLFFYPRAGTLGCTYEACAFRDDFSHFTGLGATLAGISGDTVAEQKKFASEQSLPFLLLSDPDLKVHAAYGISPTFGIFRRRATFVVMPGMKIGMSVSGNVTPWIHARRAKKFLKTLTENPGTKLVPEP